MLANIVYIGENIAQSTNNITLKPNLKSRVTIIAVSSIERHIIIMSIVDKDKIHPLNDLYKSEHVDQE